MIFAKVSSLCGFSGRMMCLMMENQFDDGKTTVSMSFRKFPRLLITIHCVECVASLLFIVVVSINRQSTTSNNNLAASIVAVLSDGYFQTDSIHRRTNEQKKTLFFESG